MTKTCATKIWLSIVCLIAKPAWLILTIVYCLSQRNRIAQYLYSQLDTGGHASTGNLFTASIFEFLWSSRCLFLRWSVWVFWRATSWLCSRLPSTKFAAPTRTTARGNTISVSVKICILWFNLSSTSSKRPLSSVLRGSKKIIKHDLVWDMATRLLQKTRSCMAGLWVCFAKLKSRCPKAQK